MGCAVVAGGGWRVAVLGVVSAGAAVAAAMLVVEWSQVWLSGWRIWELGFRWAIHEIAVRVCVVDFIILIRVWIEGLHVGVWSAMPDIR